MERIKVEEGKYYDVSELSREALTRLQSAIWRENAIRAEGRMPSIRRSDILQFDMYYDMLEATIDIVDKYRRIYLEE